MVDGGWRIVVAGCWRRAAGLALAVFLAFLGAAPPARAVVVSLGDSYSSGEGTRLYDYGTWTGCHRGPFAWPRLLDVAKGHHFACSGARIGGLYGNQNRAGASARGQLQSLMEIAAQTRVSATMITLGGNDLDFAKLLKECWRPDAPIGKSRSCVDEVEAAFKGMAAVEDRLGKAYGNIRAASGGAPVLVVGYPDLVPDLRERSELVGCRWLSKPEHEKVATLMTRLEAMLRRAASAAGVTYVSVRSALDKHELCTQKSWMVPVVSVSGNTIQEMGHPNVDGQKAIAERVRPALAAALNTASPPLPPTPPAVPAPPPALPPSGTPAPTPPNAPAPAPLRRELTVDNRVTNGMGMREDPTPTRLNTRPWARCSTRGCAIAGTERGTGGTYDAAVCQTFGDRTTNGHDGSPADDRNPALFSSTRYYGVRLATGAFGYVSEVWVVAGDRGGLGLPSC